MPRYVCPSTYYLHVKMKLPKHVLVRKRERNNELEFLQSMPYSLFRVWGHRDYFPKQGPIDIQDCRSQQGQQTQQSFGVTLVVTEETY